MEINTNIDINTARAQTGGAAQDRQAAPAKLAEGQVVTGEIVNLSPDSISVSTEDGVVTASLRGLPAGVKIGDKAEFITRLSDSGEPVLEIKQMTSEAAQKAILSDVLNLAGLKTSPENIKMALTLLDSGLPLTKENLLRFNQATKLMGADKTEEALFMLKNGLKLSPSTSHALDRLLTGEAVLMKQLNSLASSISNISDPVLRERLTALFDTNTANIFDSRDAGALPKSVLPESLLSESEPSKAAARIAQAFNELPIEDFERFSEALMKAADAPDDNIMKNPKLADALLKEVGQDTASAADGAMPGVSGEPTDMKDILKGLVSLKSQFADKIDNMIKNRDTELSRLIDLISDDNIDVNKKADIIKAFKIAVKPDGLTQAEESYIDSKLTELQRSKDLADTVNTAGHPPEKNFGKMRFDPRNTEPADVERFLNELNKSISDAKAELLKSPSPQSSGIMKELSDITSSLELNAQLRENLFLQLPIVINNHESNSELFIFKDSKRKKRGGAQTALIALDTANLDRIETYIHKDGSSVSLQFKVKTEGIRDIVSYSIDKLSEQLKDRGFIMQSCLFGLLAENFTILDSPPTASDGRRHEPVAANGQPMDARRIVFDVRL